MNNEYEFDKDQSLHAQEEALVIIAFIEKFESLISNFAAFVDSIKDKEDKKEAEVYLTTLRSMYAAIDGGEDNQLAQAINNKQDFITKFPNKIKRLGIANEIVKSIKEKGMSIEAVAERYGLSSMTVSRFMKLYDKASPVNRKELTKNNVYDIETNMQRIHAMLLRQLSKFESDGDVSSKFMSEYRQLLQLADKQLKDWNSIKKIDRLQALIFEIFSNTLKDYPDLRVKILEEFRSVGIKGLTAEVRPILETK
jgi:transcriptional regulator with XRE-family HTH domain